MNDKKYYPKGQGPQEKKGYSLESDTNIADVLKQFADADYAHQPGYFGSVEVVLVARKTEQPRFSANPDDTQPYLIH